MGQGSINMPGYQQGQMGQVLAALEAVHNFYGIDTEKQRQNLLAIQAKGEENKNATEQTKSAQAAKFADPTSPVSKASQQQELLATKMIGKQAGLSDEQLGPLLGLISGSSAVPAQNPNFPQGTYPDRPGIGLLPAKEAVPGLSANEIAATVKSDNPMLGMVKEQMQAKSAANVAGIRGEFQQGVTDAKLAAQEAKYQAALAGNAEKANQKKSEQQGHAMQTTMQLLESARGNPAAAQAEKDLYAAQKADSLLNLYGDPNKLSPQQVNLLASEIGKIASGGVPTQHELQGITPDTFQGKLANITQRFTNEPSSANAGKFLKQYQDYANALRTDAKRVIGEKYGRVIEGQKQNLGDENYATLKTQYLDRFKNEKKPAGQDLLKAALAEIALRKAATQGGK